MAILTNGNIATYVGKYDGEFVNDLFHGYGVLELDDKTIFEGNFEMGVTNGFGRLILGNGNVNKLRLS